MAKKTYIQETHKLTPSALIQLFELDTTGVDGNKLREQFPKLQMIGHFNKMVMTRGEEAMRDEFERLKPLMKSGGFIPSVDHQTHPGVSMEQYRQYLRLLQAYTES